MLCITRLLIPSLLYEWICQTLLAFRMPQPEVPKPRYVCPREILSEGACTISPSCTTNSSVVYKCITENIRVDLCYELSFNVVSETAIPEYPGSSTCAVYVSLEDGPQWKELPCTTPTIQEYDSIKYYCDEATMRCYPILKAFERQSAKPPKVRCGTRCLADLLR